MYDDNLYELKFISIIFISFQQFEYFMCNYAKGACFHA